MYTLFYKFIIDELLVNYFKQNNVESGDKYYLMIEDVNLRHEFYEALKKSLYAVIKEVTFEDDKGFETTALTNHFIILDYGDNKQLLVSDCDTNNDGLQTKIRNSVGVPGNEISNMAACFILPGSNALETLLTAGHNLQAKSFPLNAEEIVKAIEGKISGTINNIEKEYLFAYLKKIKSQEDYSSLFDFAPILSILQSGTLLHRFNELGAFEDSTIYQDLFELEKPKERVKENTLAFSKIADCMSETYEDDQYKSLCKILDSRLASKIVKDPDNWKNVDWKDVKKSIQLNKENAVLYKPEIQTKEQGVSFVCRTIGTDRKSTTYIIVCDSENVCPVLKFKFNKNLADFNLPTQDNVRIFGENVYFTLEFGHILKTKIGNDKNNHKIIALRLQTQNIFAKVQNFFKIETNSKCIILDIPSTESKVILGNGQTCIYYDNISAIRLSNDEFLSVKREDEISEILIPFIFGNNEIDICFKFETGVIPPTTIREIIYNIWSNEGEGYTFDQKEIGDISSILSENESLYLPNRFRSLARLEMKMIENQVYHLRIENSDFGNEENIIFEDVHVDSSIKDALNSISNYFFNRNTIPSLCKPNEDLCRLYEKYLEAVHAQINQIPIGESLNSAAIEISNLGIVEYSDGTLLLSPFHPLMIAYILEMKRSVDNKEFNKKVIDELSPLSLMPYLNFKKHTMQAVVTSETEDFLTWVKYIGTLESNEITSSKSTSKLITDKIKDFVTHFRYYFPTTSCPLCLSAVGLNNSVDLIRGIVDYIAKQKDAMQYITIHEYVENLLTETFFEKINRNTSRDNISTLFDANNINVKDEDLNDIIHLLFTRVSYYKHTYRDTRKLEEYSHIVFYKINTGSRFSPLPANQLRTETVLNGLVSSPSTVLDAQNNYLMGFGTNGLKDTDSPIYRIALDMNSLYAGLFNGGFSAYSNGQCTAKIFSFDDADFLESVYQNATWVTFINPQVDINFFYKQENVYVVHYVEQHSISAKLENITVTKHTEQYNNLLFNSLQTFKSVLGTSDNFSRKMINYFNCLNGKWLLEIIRKPELVIREKTSLVATCMVMEHFLKRASNIIWIPVALDEIVKATGAIGTTTDGLFSKRNLGIEGPLSDDILMIGLECAANLVCLHFYPVEVKVLSNNAISHGEIQVVNLYNRVLKEFLFTGNSFTRKMYRALFASQFLSNSEKMRANGLISESTYNIINNYRYELLNVKFSISEILSQDLGNAALVVYSDVTSKSIRTENIDGVSVCHIKMMEADCYKIVANPDTELLDFVEKSAIIMDEPQSPTTSVRIQVPITPNETHSIVVPEQTQSSVVPVEILENPLEPIKIIVGQNSVGEDVIFEPNNSDKVTHPNVGIIGTMGTGKTQFARSIIAQYSREQRHNLNNTPMGMLVFDYKGDYNDDEFLNIVKGECYFDSFPFNPLTLVVTPRFLHTNLPSITADRITDSLCKSFNLGQVQRNSIKEAIMDAYEHVGITEDNATWGRLAPTMKQVVDIYFDTHDARDTVYTVFSVLRDYSIFVNDSSQCVSLLDWLKGVKVIDLTIFDDNVKKLIVSLILDLFYAEMKQLGPSRQKNGIRELRAMILVDEAHQFLGMKFDSLRKIICEGRAFGVGMILSTQNISDFRSDEDYTQFILSWIIHHVNNATTRDLANIFGANDPHLTNYSEFIMKAEKFQSLCKIGGSVRTIRDLPYYKLVETDSRFIKE